MGLLSTHYWTHNYIKQHDTTQRTQHFACIHLMFSSHNTFTTPNTTTIMLAKHMKAVICEFMPSLIRWCKHTKSHSLKLDFFFNHTSLTEDAFSISFCENGVSYVSSYLCRERVRKEIRHVSQRLIYIKTFVDSRIHRLKKKSLLSRITFFWQV